MKKAVSSSILRRSVHKTVPDSYARKIYNDALADNTKKTSGEDAWSCKIIISTNTSKDMAPDKWWQNSKPKCCFSPVFGMARCSAALRSRSVEEMLRKGI